MLLLSEPLLVLVLWLNVTLLSSLRSDMDLLCTRPGYISTLVEIMSSPGMAPKVGGKHKREREYIIYYFGMISHPRPVPVATLLELSLLSASLLLSPNSALVGDAREPGEPREPRPLLRGRGVFLSSCFALRARVSSLSC